VGRPVGGEFYDWMCTACIEKFRQGDCPSMDELRDVCTACIRQMQGMSRLHFPVETGDGSWRYDEELVVDACGGDHD